LSDVTTLSLKNKYYFYKIVLRIPSTLHSTLASAGLGFAIGSRLDLRRERLTHCIKQLHYLELQQDQNLLALLTPSSLNFRYRYV